MLTTQQSVLGNSFRGDLSGQLLFKAVGYPCILHAALAHVQLLVACRIH